MNMSKGSEAVRAAISLNNAISVLSGSDRGRDAIRDLLALLDNGGLSLDHQGQRAVLALLELAWGSKPGSTLEAMREATSK